MAFQDSFEEIAKDLEMTGETYKVLMYLYSKLDFENFIQQSQMDIAEGLGIQKQRVSRAMKVLTSKQIVLEGPKSWPVAMLPAESQNYGWKGKVKTPSRIAKGTIQSHRRWQRVNLIYSIF